MPRFPKLLTTGDPVSIIAQPVLRKPLDVSNLLRATGRSTSGKTSSTKSKTTKDDPIKGRIGGVNQIYADYNKYMAQAKSILNTLGPAGVFTPEYSNSIYGAQRAMAPERINTLEVETEYLKKYSEKNKDKGHFYNIDQFLKGADITSLRTNTEWDNYLQRVHSRELGDETKDNLFETFSWNNYDATDADFSAAIDEIYDNTGVTSVAGLTKAVFSEKEIGDAVGIHKHQLKYLNESNFANINGANYRADYQWKDDKGNIHRGAYLNKKGEPVRDENGAIVNKLTQLEKGYNIASMRALQGAIDTTDPVQNRMFQMYLQNSGGRRVISAAEEAAHEYNLEVDKKNQNLKEGEEPLRHKTPFEFLMDDYQRFAGEYLENDYLNRRQKKVNSENVENFNELSESGYTRREKKLAMIALAEQAKVMQQTLSGTGEAGVPLDVQPAATSGGGILGLLTGRGETGAKSVIDGIMGDKEFEDQFIKGNNSPFVIVEKDGKKFYKPNTAFDQNTWNSTIEQTIKDKKMTPEQAQAYRNDMYDYKNKMNSAYNTHRTNAVDYATTSDVLTFSMRTAEGKAVHDMFNFPTLNGQEMNGFLNTPLRIGQTTLNSANFGKGLKSVRVGDQTLTFQLGTIPTNGYLFVKNTETGGYSSMKLDSDDFLKLSDAEQSRLLNNGLVMTVSPTGMQEFTKNPGAYNTPEDLESLRTSLTSFTQPDGNSVLKPQSVALQEYFAKTLEDPNTPATMQYLGGQYYADATYEVTNPATAFKDIAIDVPVTRDYASDPEYKKAWDIQSAGNGPRLTSLIFRTGYVTDQTIKHIQNLKPGASKEEAIEIIAEAHEYGKNKPELVAGQGSIKTLTTNAGKHAMTNLILGKSDQLNYDQSMLVNKKMPILDASGKINDFAKPILNLREEEIEYTNEKGQKAKRTATLVNFDQDVTSTVYSTEEGKVFNKKNRERSMQRSANRARPTNNNQASKLNPSK